MDDDLSSIEILGVPVARMDREAALRAIEKLYEAPEPALVLYINAHSLNLAHKDADYRAILMDAPLLLNDGSGVAIAARIGGRRFPENLNGSDFNPAILALAAQRGWSVYLLGAGRGVAVRAAEILVAHNHGLRIAGARDGYFDPASTAPVVDEIRASGAGVVMVAMGNPLQEKWLAANLERTGAKLGIGVGAFFDFTAQVVPRAPEVFNRFGVEWVWRLLQEPRRMWRRYVVGNPVFLWRVLKVRTRAWGAGKLKS